MITVYINKEIGALVGPFRVVLFDAMDAFYYADIMDHMETVGTYDSYAKAVAIEDAYFIVKNKNWKSLYHMNSVDKGYDVRVFNKDYPCVYAAHERFKEKWIGE